ncbi:MAG: hypothetical protein LBD23_17550 [Oscillospiraceae bacterium]|nr:hypothetical protein [Oscillospiraceae bacterium]
MEGIKVDTLITIGTPVREYTPGNAIIEQHINIYNSSDPVQVVGGSAFSGFGANRTFDGAINILATDVTTNLFKAHSSMHNNVDLWRDQISQSITFDAPPVISKRRFGK